MITIIGSLNYDLVTFTDKVPEGGETLQANSFENHLGGKGLNEALACARLSLNGRSDVRMIGNIGADAFGRELKQTLVDANVDTKYVRTIKNQSSGVAVILVETSGENRILITAGANGDLKPTCEEFETFFEDSSTEGDFVILQNEFPHTLESIRWIKSHKPTINIAYNPSPFNRNYITSETLSKIDFLIVNEGEALDVAHCILNEEEMSQFHNTILQDKVKGYGSLAQKLQTQLDQQNISTVIITMGSLGSVFASKTREASFVQSQKIDNVIDTTGAGDTFFGGVILQLSDRQDIEVAIKFATAASGLAIQKKGAAEGIPHFEDVNKMI
ncbi:Ribokinase-like protein [Metschnikowia bicuspidata var. bicuspidata NRRL YB-4993]|uniref:Ribokinase n=1 Tax=Metschnikowia bicuspidata var. bicuspidata NRRL YB-4993 TaxID=869754 RepID=A0A1A0H4T5_9ASCO|nr:Ribokinase-like protein [Metschnikowia bicuspidata var. bicuspidata NRRL YB-4993]OBA19089.1 Ribokinase-like protein [Metschnikowia bicuspidata var. bicuspidata NRRL YB-4993]